MLCVCQSKSPPIHFSQLPPRCIHPKSVTGRKTRYRKSFDSCRLQMPPCATPFLTHPYKCPGGMGVNTPIPKVLLELRSYISRPLLVLAQKIAAIFVLC